MPTIEGLANLASLQKAQLDQTQQQSRIDAAKQAADLFKQGDIKGALGAMAAVDPDHVGNYIKQYQDSDPSTQQSLKQAQSQGATQGEYNVTTPAGANPRQLLDQQGANQLAVAQAKAKAMGSKPRVLKDPNSPTGFTVVSPDGTAMPIDNYNGDAAAAAQKTQKQDQSAEEPKAPKLRPNEDIDSNGQKVLLSPEQQKTINTARKSFDSDTKEIVKGLDAAEKSIQLIDTNTPGARTVEALTTLKSAIGGRVGQQEFQAYGKGMGIINQINNAISEAEGKGMSPETQKFMSRLVRTSAEVLGKEFDSHLQNTIERTPEVDPLILKKRLVGSHGPSAYKAVADKVSKLPPEDQAAFNWAHDNPSDPRAKKILSNLGL